MSKFIWVRDRDKTQHYINVDHIVRLCKSRSALSGSDFSYLVLAESNGTKYINLSDDEKIYDTFDEVVKKIDQ